jgi:hypothetical protein
MARCFSQRGLPQRQLGWTERICGDFILQSFANGAQQLKSGNLAKFDNIENWIYMLNRALKLRGL